MEHFLNVNIYNMPRKEMDVNFKMCQQILSFPNYSYIFFKLYKQNGLNTTVIEVHLEFSSFPWQGVFDLLPALIRKRTVKATSISSWPTNCQSYLNSLFQKFSIQEILLKFRIFCFYGQSGLVNDDYLKAFWSGFLVATCWFLLKEGVFCKLDFYF